MSVLAHITSFEVSFIFGVFLAGIAIGYSLGIIRTAIKAEQPVEKR